MRAWISWREAFFGLSSWWWFIMFVDQINHVLIVTVYETTSANDICVSGSPREVVMAIVNGDENGHKMRAQHGRLLQFHWRLSHLCYDTIVKVARDPISGIRLTDTKQVNWLACAQDKQTKIRKSSKDGKTHSLIDVIGGVIISDLEGPLSHRDCLGNSYVFNIVDSRSNTCWGFLAKTKYIAAMNFKISCCLWATFSCRIYVLRTDGGVKYNPLNVFCKVTAVYRQISERDNQFSIGKAERMHCINIKMVRAW